MTETPGFELSTVEEGSIESEESSVDLEFKRSLVTGELADRVRERFGANKHVPVYFIEYQQEYGGCPTCYGIDDVLTVECGEHRRTFYVDDGLPLNELLAWFDEPRRQAEREAAVRAKVEQQRVNDAAFQANVVQPIADAMARVEAEGYSSDGEWHDKVMVALGVKGVRYRS